jgi:hypothetical protein
MHAVARPEDINPPAPTTLIGSDASRRFRITNSVKRIRSCRKRRSARPECLGLLRARVARPRRVAAVRIHGEDFYSQCLGPHCPLQRPCEDVFRPGTATCGRDWA